MSGLSLNQMQGLYTDLTSQISNSVKNIKSKQEQGGAFQASSLLVNDTQSSMSYTSGSFAFSYLEPSSLHNLQKILQEPSFEQGLRNHSQNQQQVADDNENNAAVQDNENQTSQIVTSFLDELHNQVPQIDAASVAKMYRQNQLSQPSMVSMVSGISNFNLSDIKYANDAYSFNFNINNTPQVRIEFMHKYNRSFDYSV